MLGKAELDLKLILKILGFLLMVEGVFMLTSLPFSYYYHEGQHIAILLSSVITSGTGFLVYMAMGRRERNSVNKREGFVIVTMTWVLISFFGTLPFLLSRTIPTFTNAFFETMSGFTTTGASILTDIEALPKSILFWRSMTHWIGGMGIIVLTVAILPFLGIGGMQLYSAEMPGVTKDKLHPRITETACLSVIRPASTKLTSMTVLALELCIMAVTRVPARQPVKRFDETMLRIERILLPAIF